jgi:hypothetical protein
MLKRLAGMPPDMIPEMLLVLAEQQDVEEKRKEAQRERTRRHRDRNVTVTSPSRYTAPVIENAAACEPARVEDISSRLDISESEEKIIPPQAKSKRGTRIPDGFVPDIDAAVADGLNRSKAEFEAKRFRDYYIAAPGQKGVKLDWPATWRNWYRTAIERMGTGPPWVSAPKRGSAALSDYCDRPISETFSDERPYDTPRKQGFAARF